MSTSISLPKGHINSVECVSYWAAQRMILSGDWSGNIFGWSVKSVESGEAVASDDNTTTKKKQKGDKGAVNSSSSVRYIHIVRGCIEREDRNRIWIMAQSLPDKFIKNEKSVSSLLICSFNFDVSKITGYTQG